MITLQTDPTASEGWYLIEAYGEHTKTLEDGTEIIEIIDAETAQALSAQSLPAAGVLIDRDHLSREDDHSTEAMGWCKQLAGIDVGIVGYIEWSSIGHALKKGKVYQHFSTEYEMPEIIEGKVYPRKIVGLALTNRPNNEAGQRPISNRKNCGLKNTENQQTDNTMTEEEMKALAAILGLAEDATAAQITEEAKALIDRCAVAEEAEAEAILNTEDTAEMSEEEKELMKEELIKNRARALKILANRRGTSAPKAQPSAARKYQGSVLKNRGGVMGTPSRKASAEAIRDRAYDIQRNTGCSYFEALRLANK